MKIDETWGIASPLPREHIPKRSRPKDQRILRIVGEIKRDWGFLNYSRTSIQMSSWFQKIWHAARCTGITPKSSMKRHNQVHRNRNENPSHKTQNEGIESNKKPRGHEEDRASFPNQIPYKVSTIHGQNQLKREEQREGDARAAAWRTEVSTSRLEKPQLT